MFHITSYTVPLRLRQPSTPYQKSYKLCVAIRSLTKLRWKRVLFPFSSSLRPSTVSLPDSITLCFHNIPFSDSARNLGVLLDSNLYMKKHFIKLCQTAYFELKSISSIRRFLTEDAAKTLVTSYILSRLGHCSCLLVGTLNSVIKPLFAARLVLLAPRHHHSTHLMEKLHWLPISERITYKVACMCFSAMNGSGPAYLSELLHVYTPSRTLHSSSDSRMLKIQQHERKSHGFRAVSCFGPHIRSSLHKTLKTAQPCQLLKPNWKPSSSHSISTPTNINTQFLLVIVCMCARAHVYVCVCFYIIPYVKKIGRRSTCV